MLQGAVFRSTTTLSFVSRTIVRSAVIAIRALAHLVPDPGTATATADASPYLRRDAFRPNGREP